MTEPQPALSRILAPGFGQHPALANLSDAVEALARDISAGAIGRNRYFKDSDTDWNGSDQGVCGCVDDRDRRGAGVRNVGAGGCACAVFIPPLGPKKIRSNSQVAVIANPLG